MDDRDRYPWRFEVRDAFDRPKVIGVGAERGRIIFYGPGWFSASEDIGDSITAAWAAASERARVQRQAGHR